MPGAANAHLIEAVDGAIATLQAALEAFGGPDSQSQGEEQPSKSDVCKAAERVRGEATKVGVMCGGGDAAAMSPDAARALLGGFEQAGVAFCAAARALASGDRAGPTLRASVRKLAMSVVEPCADLLRAVGAGDDVKRAVGRVWGACDAVTKAPLDDRAALFRALAAAMTAVKDAEREMTELEEEAEESGGSGSGDEDESERRQQQQQQASTAAAAAAAAAQDGSPELDYYEAGPLARHERALVAAARGLTSACAAVVRALGRALLRGPPLDGDSDARDAWESLAYHAGNLQRCIEDVGAAAYPPQDVGELLAAAESAATTAVLMLDEAPEGVSEGREGGGGDGGGGDEPFGALAAAVEAAAARVVEAGAAAEAASAERD